MSDKKAAGTWLIGVGLLLAIAAVGWWLWGSADAEKRQDRADALAIFMDRPAEDISPNRAGPVALGATAGVLFLSGVILVAMPGDQRS